MAHNFHGKLRTVDDIFNFMVDMQPNSKFIKDDNIVISEPLKTMFSVYDGCNEYRPDDVQYMLHLHEKKDEGYRVISLLPDDMFRGKIEQYDLMIAMVTSDKRYHPDVILL